MAEGAYSLKLGHFVSGPYDEGPALDLGFGMWIRNNGKVV